jgi:hypothetical protein
MLLMNLTAFSQVAILDSATANTSKVKTFKVGKDTVVGFSVLQSKYLLKKHNNAEKCDTLLTICEKQKVECDSLRKDNLEEINNFQIMLSNKNTMIGIREEELKKTEAALEEANKQVRKQKAYKLVAIGGAVAVIVAETIFFVKYIISHP